MEQTRRMIRRASLLLLAAMLAVVLATASPALAESEPVVEATGVLEKPGATTYQYGTHAITDEASGTTYALLQSQGVDLDAYVGERVTISGAPVPVATISGDQNGNVESGPDLLRVDRVEPADGPPGPPPGLPTATLSFELAVECEPPASATFLGFTSFESFVTVPLTDDDGDGLYTGSITVPKFPPGPVPTDAEPVSLSFQIVQGPPTRVTTLGPEFRVIKDFGSVKLDEDKTLTASVSFCDAGGGSDDGSGKDGGSNNGSGSKGTVSGDTGAGSSSSGPASASGSAAASGGSGTKTLPATGGATLFALGTGALLIGGGLLVRRIVR